MLPDSVFNSVSVVKGKGSFKISFHIQTLLLLALLWNCCCCSCILRAMCTFAGRIHLCSSFPAISQVHGTVRTLQPKGFPIYTLIIFSSILQRICFCKNCLYGRGELDAMSSAHQQFCCSFKVHYILQSTACLPKHC